ncbi:alpha/beta fold hydrolase [Schlegelella sp. S2-27]|uniref:Alpha/beta fold hydrolase n=1 Tax=Caldimonas mangrovi TaxID=2944811 RepID=A0ABT0YQ88_9BURK|nr:alpha/beta fold hydrolase [Caldimonas mangrovi]MCM5680579.1 alpha/beta fold hydrolase [Caldimonas mangrovi]
MPTGLGCTPPLAPALLPLSCRLRAGTPGAPLLVLLHGAGSDETSLWPVARPLPRGWNVVLVRAPRPMPRGGFFWYPVHFRRRGVHVDADQVEAALVRLAEFLDRLPQLCRFDAGRVVLAGFSQGAALASALALRQPYRVTGVGMLSGRLLSSVQASSLTSGLLPRLRFFIGHGLHDRVLPMALAVQATRWLRSHGVRVTARAYDAGHEATPAMVAGLTHWLQALASEVPGSKQPGLQRPG